MNNHYHGRRQARRPSALQQWLERRRERLNSMTRTQRIRRRILVGVICITAVVVAVWTALALWIRPPEVPNPGLPSSGNHAGSTSGEHTSENWETEIPDIVKSGRKEGVYTFLVAGLDVASGATDTMLLLSYDINAKTVQGLNLPRDTILNVSYNSKRLNTIYTINKGKDTAAQAEKGMDALGAHVAKITGITPDYYVLLEWEAIGELVNAIGGVEFNVPFDMNYDDPYQDPPLHIHQQAGLRTLNGDDAMQVIRWRKNNDGSNPQGDVGRLAIQQDFLKAVVKKCLQPAIVLKIPALAEIFVDNVKTDLSVGNILALAKSAIGMDPNTGVTFRTAPLAADAWYKGAAMVTLDGEGILEIVNSGMNPYLRDIQFDDLELIYKKADGSYGVTKGTLADPAMGVVKVVEPEPEVEDEPVEEPVDPTVDPDGTEPTDPTVDPGVTEPANPTEDPAVSEPVDPNAPQTQPEDPVQSEPGEEIEQTSEQPLPETQVPGTPDEGVGTGEQPPADTNTDTTGSGEGAGEEIPEHLIPVIP